MQLSLRTDDLLGYVFKQVNHFFPDGQAKPDDDVRKAYAFALERAEYCFSKVKIKGYQRNGNAYFNHLHADQYSAFLYFFANSLWKMSQHKMLCDKLIVMNRSLHGIWFSYKGHLPDIFVFDHPIGAILGNAEYSDYLVVHQNVTVNTGAYQEGGRVTPALGSWLFLAAGAKIIGDETVGNRVSIGVDACVYKKSVPDDTLVYRDATGAICEKRHRCIAEDYFYTE